MRRTVSRITSVRAPFRWSQCRAFWRSLWISRKYPCPLVFSLCILLCRRSLWILQSQVLTPFYCSRVSKGQILPVFSALSNTCSLALIDVAKGNSITRTWWSSEFENHESSHPILLLKDCFEMYSLQRFFKNWPSEMLTKPPASAVVWLPDRV